MHEVDNANKGSYKYVCQRFIFSSKGSLMRIVIMYVKDSLKDSLSLMRVVKCESK